MLAIRGVQAEITRDARLYRPAEQKIVVESHDKLTHETDWRPRVAWADTLALLTQDWAARVALEPA
jgi:GDP-D-mannose dehydratase